jgi:hypothetical protein
MATPAENLQTAYEQACARLAELDVVPISERARMTYTADNGQTFDWNGYRNSLLAQIKDFLTGKLLSQAAGPFEYVSIARG